MTDAEGRDVTPRLPAGVRDHPCANLPIATVAEWFPEAMELFDTQLPHMSRATSIVFSTNRRGRLRAAVSRQDVEALVVSEREVAWHYARICKNHARHLAMREVAGLPVDPGLRSSWDGSGPTPGERAEIVTLLPGMWRMFAWWHPLALAWVRHSIQFPSRMRHDDDCPGTCEMLRGVPSCLRA